MFPEVLPFGRVEIKFVLGFSTPFFYLLINSCLWSESSIAIEIEEIGALSNKKLVGVEKSAERWNVPDRAAELNSYFQNLLFCCSSVPDKRQRDASTKSEPVFDGVYRLPCICYSSEAPVTRVFVDMSASPSPASIVLCIWFSNSLDLHLCLESGHIF